MGVHMESQIIYLMEGFVAYRTLKLFFSGMSKFMILIIAFLVETLATEFAHVRFVAQVNAHVCIESAASVKGLSAGLTFVGLL